MQLHLWKPVLSHITETCSVPTKAVDKNTQYLIAKLLVYCSFVSSYRNALLSDKWYRNSKNKWK